MVKNQNLTHCEEVFAKSQFRPILGLLWLDCRFDLKDPELGAKRYEEGHIPGAVYAHLDRDLSAAQTALSGRHPLPSPQLMKERFESLGVSSERRVIVYDDSDMAFAARAWWMLKFLGHTQVSVLNGGWSAFRAAGGSAEQGRNHPARGNLQINLQTDWLVSSEAVTSQNCLVDSRDAARFRGDVEPIDPVAGHIPGAKNFFYRQNLTEELKFKPSDLLKAQLQAFYKGSRPPTFYCGSGVTACVNVLAASVAEMPMPKLYAGSWSEWIRDSSRPVAKGT